MTAAPITAMTSTPVITPTDHSLISQNIFEHVVANARTLPQGASPADLGSALIENLKGFLDRTGKFSSRISEAGKPASQPSFAYTEPNTALPERIQGKQLDHVIASLGSMFDHSIETQMIVRSTTQISGAVNTLVKGQ